MDYLADIDAMWEADAAAEWEEINEPDPMEDLMKTAAESISKGLDEIDDGLDWIADAVSTLGDSPMAYRVQSLQDDMVKLAYELERLRDRYERGDRG